MFDLEIAIADWKQSLASLETVSDDNVAELETHLRECVTTLDAMGLNSEEAFLIAQRRIGPPCELDAEFAKESSSTRWLNRGKWMCIGILALIITRTTGSLLYGIIQTFEILPEADPITQATIYHFSAIAFSWLVILFGLFVVFRHDTWIDRIVQRLTRIPKLILFGLPVATITALVVFMSFNILMTSAYGRTAFRLSSFGFVMSPPILFLMAFYVLHRVERNRA